jgi:hypothetical protein
MPGEAFYDYSSPRKASRKNHNSQQTLISARTTPLTPWHRRHIPIFSGLNYQITRLPPSRLGIALIYSLAYLAVSYRGQQDAFCLEPKYIHTNILQGRHATHCTKSLTHPWHPSNTVEGPIHLLTHAQATSEVIPAARTYQSKGIRHGGLLLQVVH